jgi:hypothetical protein
MIKTLKQYLSFQVLFAILITILASLPSLLFIKACKNPKFQDPNNYCVGIRTTQTTKSL